MTRRKPTMTINRVEDTVDNIPALVCDPSRRHEFVYIFEVITSNPNGDPDAMNAPRTIAETGHGLVTDVSIKRKVRDYVSMTTDLPIFIQSDVALNEKKKLAADGMDPPLTAKERSSKAPNQRLAQRMWDIYYDIRLFGAVLATGDKSDRLNAGKVTGPIQMNFATSLDPVTVKFNANSRKARTSDARLETGETEFGITTPIVPYGVYRTHGFFNPFLAEKTGASEADLKLFWEALIGAFELSRSRSRPEINVRGLLVFSHENKLGHAPAHKLLSRVGFRLRDGVNSPMKFEDYQPEIDESGLPDGVKFTPLVDPRR